MDIMMGERLGEPAWGVEKGGGQSWQGCGRKEVKEGNGKGVEREGGRG